MLKFYTPRQPSLGDPTVTPSRLRLQSVDTDWESAGDAILSTARLIVPYEGGAIRTIITGGKKHATGVYPSRKTGSRQYWEGFPERWMILESEVAAWVIDYQTQPFRFEFVYDGTPYTYIADHCRQLEDGTVEVIEVKRTERDLSDPDYRLKLACVHELCRQVTWSFKVAFLHRSQTTRNRQRNLELIQSRRFVTIRSSHLQALADFRRKNGPESTYEALTIALSEGHAFLGRAVVQALIARGLLTIDLDRPLVSNTPVTILEPATPAASSLRN